MSFLTLKNVPFMVFSGLILRCKGRKNIIPQKGSSNSQYANTYKPTIDSDI
jgi:hypothetical protein